MVMINKYFSIFQQWIELGVYYLGFNLGRSQISSEDKYVFQLCLGRHFPHIFYSWEVPRREPKARAKMRSWNQLAQIQWHCLSWAGDEGWSETWLKKWNYFILSTLVHLPPTAQGKYPSQFASRYSICKFATIAVATIKYSGFGLGFSWKISFGTLQMIESEQVFKEQTTMKHKSS